MIIQNPKVKLTVVCFALFWPIQAMSRDETPDWIEGESSQYVSHQYITATASASERERASTRALANLSRLFHVPDNETLSLESNPLLARHHDDDSLIRKLELEKREQPVRDLLLGQARVVETWKDKEVHVYYALAVLERESAAAQIRDAIAIIDADTENQLEAIRGTDDALKVISGLSQAIHLQQERLAIQRMLDVIESPDEQRVLPYNLTEMYAELNQQISLLHIGAAVDKDPVGQLKDLLRSAMGNAGFPASASGQDYTLIASLSVQDLGKRHGWYWMKGVLELKLVSRDGKIRGRKEWPVKASALDHDDAESRLLSQLGEKLDDEVRHAMIDFATSNYK